MGTTTPASAWRLSTKDVTIHPSHELTSIFHPTSLPLHLPASSNVVPKQQATPDGADVADPQPASSPHVTLPQFEGCVLQSCQFQIRTSPPAASSTSTSSAIPAAPTSADFNLDLVGYTGGLIWRVEFCPNPLTPSPPPPSSVATPDPSPGPSSDLSLASEAQLLAVSVHPAGSNRHKLGAPLQGPGAVQLWAVPHSSLSPACPDGLPRMVMGLMHSGRTTWDIQWCPDPAMVPSPSQAQQTAACQKQQGAAGSQLQGIGALAMVLGSGCVEVVVVPQLQSLLEACPEARQQQQGQQGQQGSAGDAMDVDTANAGPSHSVPAAAAAAAAAAPGPLALALRVSPSVTITQAHLGGSMPSCCAWQPRPGAGRSALLVGCWDGTVTLWRLPTSPLQQLMGLFHIRADSLPIRRVLWQPPPPAPSASQDHALVGERRGGDPADLLQDDDYDNGVVDRIEDHLFFTAGNSGRVAVWDTRDVSGPVFDKLIHRSTCYEACVMQDPNGVACGLEDGTLRLLHIDPLYFSHSLHDGWLASFEVPGCLWSCDYHPGVQAIAYCGEDGVLALMAHERAADARHRRPHTALGGLASKDGRVLQVLSPQEAMASASLYAGGSYFRGGALAGGGTGTGHRKGPRPGGRGSKAKTAEPVDAEELPGLLQTLYTCRFSQAGRRGVPGQGEGVPFWLAYGGTAGVLRLQRLSTVAQ